MKSNTRPNLRERHDHRFRRLLLRQQAEVAAYMREHRQFLRNAGNAEANEALEIAANELEAGVLAQAVETDSTRLAQIEDALDRIAHGHYGVCEECGKKISQARLEALPYAALCIRCQSVAETHQGSWHPAQGRRPSLSDFTDLDVDDEQEDLEPVALDTTNVSQVENGHA